LPEVLRVTDPWGDEIVLTEEDVARIDAKRGDDIGEYLDAIRPTLEHPNVVYEGRYLDSKVFYGRDLLPDSSPFRGVLCGRHRSVQRYACECPHRVFPREHHRSLGQAPVR